MIRRLIILIISAGFFFVEMASAEVQNGRDLQTPGINDAVTIISEGGDDTAIRMTRDLASVLDSAALRILPIVGNDQLRNLADILSLQDVDAGIFQSDLLEYAM